MKRVNLAFSGSGQLYPAFIGVLMCLRDRGYSVAEISATSGGAIIAAAFASGFEPGGQLVSLIKSTLPVKNRLFDFSLRSLLHRWGLIKGDRIEGQFKKYFCARLSDCKIPLHITASNISARKARVISSATDPDFSTARAVRASISLPFIFAPVIIDGDIYVDGGWLMNLPCEVFKNDLPVLAFRFKNRNAVSSSIKSAAKYAGALLEAVIDGDPDRLPREPISFIDICTRYSTLSFNVNDQDVDEMVREGYVSTADWLDENESKI